MSSGVLLQTAADFGRGPPDDSFPLADSSRSAGAEVEVESPPRLPSNLSSFTCIRRLLTSTVGCCCCCCCCWWLHRDSRCRSATVNRTTASSSDEGDFVAGTELFNLESFRALRDISPRLLNWSNCSCSLMLYHLSGLGSSLSSCLHSSRKHRSVRRKLDALSQSWTSIATYSWVPQGDCGEVVSSSSRLERLLLATALRGATIASSGA